MNTNAFAIITSLKITMMERLSSLVIASHNKFNKANALFFYYLVFTIDRGRFELYKLTFGIFRLKFAVALLILKNH